MHTYSPHLIIFWQKTHMVLSPNESDWDCRAPDSRMNPISPMNIIECPWLHTQMQCKNGVDSVHTKKMAFHMHQRAVSSGNILFAQMIESCQLNDEWGSAGSYGMCPWWIVSKDHVWMMKEWVKLMQYLTGCCISAKSSELNIHCI